MEKEIICGIYKITSPSNRVYIGQSVDIDKRWKVYKKIGFSVKKQTLVYRSLLKYGVESHTFEVVEECEVEQLNNREGYWQDFYDSVNNGLNCSRVKSDDKNGYFSLDSRKKLSDALTGRKIPRHIVEKSVANRPDTKGKNHYKSKSVENFKTGVIYDSIREAAIEEGLLVSTLFGYLSGKSENPTYLRFLNEEFRPQGCGIYINRRAKIILDINSGVFYYSITEAAKYSNYCSETISRMLSGKCPNKTTLIYTN